MSEVTCQPLPEGGPRYKLHLGMAVSYLNHLMKPGFRIHNFSKAGTNFKNQSNCRQPFLLQRQGHSGLGGRGPQDTKAAAPGRRTDVTLRIPPRLAGRGTCFHGTHPEPLPGWGAPDC